MPEPEKLRQEIAWNGVGLRLPDKWVPTVIDRSYLFFEANRQPAFAVKWDRVRGSFSARRVMARLRRSVERTPVKLSPWEVPPELLKIAAGYAVTGFQCHHELGKSLGMLLFCRHCRRATLLQFYLTGGYNGNTLQQILASFTDHPQGQEQKWFMYDIRARLPVGVRLESHEFLAGRYTLSFSLPGMNIDLYRFKPAAAILKNQSLEEFGSPLAGKAVCVDRSSDMFVRWEFSASGLNRLAAITGRKPGWVWLQLRLVEDRNAILAVKGNGKRAMDRELMEHIAENFTLTEPC